MTPMEPYGRSPVERILDMEQDEMKPLTPRKLLTASRQARSLINQLTNMRLSPKRRDAIRDRLDTLIDRLIATAMNNRLTPWR